MGEMRESTKNAPLPPKKKKKTNEIGQLRVGVSFPAVQKRQKKKK